MVLLFLSDCSHVNRGTMLVMKDSVQAWAHRALVAAIDMNDVNPIDVYLTCRTEMPDNRKHYKDKIRTMEYDAREQNGSLQYLAACQYSGSDEEYIFKLTLTDGKVVKVEERRKNVKKKNKVGPDFIWVEKKTK